MGDAMTELKKNKEKWEWIFPCEYTTIRVFSGKNTICIVDNIDDAMVIVDAGNVHSETGLTPRQLIHQRNELLDALKNMASESEDAFCDVNARRPDSFRDAIFASNKIIDRIEAEQ
jgi:hypothetical protein